MDSIVSEVVDSWSRPAVVILLGVGAFAVADADGPTESGEGGRGVK